MMIIIPSCKFKREAKKKDLANLAKIKLFIHSKKPIVRDELWLFPFEPWTLELRSKHTVLMTGKIIGHWRSNKYVKDKIRKMHSTECMNKRKLAIGFPVLIEDVDGVCNRYDTILDAHRATGIPMGNIRRWCYGDCNINANNSSAPKYKIVRCEFCD